MIPVDQDPFAGHPSGGGVRLSGGQWVPKDHPLAAQAGPQAGAPAAPGPSTGGGPITSVGQVTSTTAPAGGSIAPGSPTTVAGAFQQALVSRMAPQPISASNPQVAPALAANRLSEQRGAERQRNIVAERAAASGTNMSGGFDSQLLGIDQARAQREGQFAGQTLMDLGKQQSGESSQALALAASLLGGEAQRDLQRYGIDTDARLREMGIDLGRDDLGLRGELGRGQLSLGLLGQQLGDQHFGQQLGADLGMFSASQAQDALLRLLGGL